MQISVSRNGWLVCVGLSVLTWVFMSVGLAPRGVSPILCVIPAVLPLVALLPATVKRFTRRRVFPLGWALWFGVTSTGLFFAFSRMAGLGNRCDRVFVASGIFAFVSVCALWVVDISRKRHQSRARLLSANASIARERLAKLLVAVRSDD